MDLFFFIVSIVVMSSCCSCRGMETEQDGDILMIKTTFKPNQKLLEYIEGQQEEIASLQDGQKDIMESLRRQQNNFDELQDLYRRMMENSQERHVKIEYTLRDQHAVNQLCAKQDLVEEFKNTYESGKQEILTSMEGSSCRDQLLDFQDMLAADECDDGSHNCSEVATCSDELVLYRCTCLPGYFGDGFTCTDIDECHESSATCGANERCINNPGSYECRCPEGFQMGESGCQEFVCTSPSLYLEDLGCITIILTKISWSEGKVECERLGMRLLEDIQKKHLDLLSSHFLPLRNSAANDVWVGFQNKTWLSSGHLVLQEVVAPGEGELEDLCGTFDMRPPTQYGLYDMSCGDSFNTFCQITL